MIYVAWRRALEILPIMPALCSMLFNAHYAQNYAGIIGASLAPCSPVRSSMRANHKSVAVKILQYSARATEPLLYLCHLGLEELELTTNCPRHPVLRGGLPHPGYPTGIYPVRGRIWPYC